MWKHVIVNEEGEEQAIDSEILVELDGDTVRITANGNTLIFNEDIDTVVRFRDDINDTIMKARGGN